MLLEKGDGGFFDITKCREGQQYIGMGTKWAAWQYTKGSQHLDELNILVYDKKNLKKGLEGSRHPLGFLICAK